MSLLSKLRGRGPNGFGYASTAEEVTAGVGLSGKNILLTGSNSGLGLETLRVLTLRGARVIAAARTLDKAREACATVRAGVAEPLACDLSAPTSVDACVGTLRERATRLDAVICNAGIMALPNLQQAFGYELQFFTNHIGHFMLVTGLLEQLAPNGRVVVVSSGAHRWAPPGGVQFDNLSGNSGYHPWVAYGQSKMANLLFAKELAHRLPLSGQIANAVHPGAIRTKLYRTTSTLMKAVVPLAEPLFFKNVAEGAATQCYVAVHPAVSENGEYFVNCKPARPRKAARDPELARRLWEVSERIVHEVRKAPES